MKRLLTLAVAALLSPACLVLSLNPSYDDDTIGWDPSLLGSWQDADDRSSMEIERGEWKSYRIKYVHPIETGIVTAYLTAIGDDRFLNVMPVRGEDRGSFLIPVHASVRLQLDGDRLELTPLSYDWMSERVRSRTRVPGLQVTLDHKENALIASPTAELRAWLRQQPRDGPMFGASATFQRRAALAGGTPSMLKGSQPTGAGSCLPTRFASHWRALPSQFRPVRRSTSAWE